jgi:NADPH:quinone reductase-like Zn-dependent oxidoreductase
MESYRCLARGGRLVLFGVSSAAPGAQAGLLSMLKTLIRIPWCRLHPLRLMNENRAVAGVNLGRMWGEGERLSGWMDEILARLAAGDYAPHVDRVFPFTAAGEAHTYIHERRNVGKVLLAPDPDALEVTA